MLAVMVETIWVTTGSTMASTCAAKLMTAETMVAMTVPTLVSTGRKPTMSAESCWTSGMMSGPTVVARFVSAVMMGANAAPRGASAVARPVNAPGTPEMKPVSWFIAPVMTGLSAVMTCEPTPTTDA